MKKTYEAPALVSSGDIVRTTNASTGGAGDNGLRGEAIGSVGFGL